MYYLLCCAGELLKDFLEWTVESCFLSSAIAHLRVSSRALLISALKSIENCQSGEISFAVRGPSEWARVCQTVCGMLLIKVEATPSGRRGRKVKATLCSDVPTLEWRLMLQNRLPQFTDLLHRLCDWNSAPYWPCVQDYIALVASPPKMCQGQECFYLRHKSTNQ